MSARPLQPTSADFRKWRRLVKEARRVAAQPRGAAGDLRAAAATARRAVAPTHELLRTTCSPLIRLAEAWPTLSDACLDTSAQTLLRLAVELAPHVNAPNEGVAAMKHLMAQRPGADSVERPLIGAPVRTGMRGPASASGDLFGDQDDREPRKDIFG